MLVRALLLCLIATPLAAWEFTPDPICTLSNPGEGAETVVTYDARLPEYAIAITLADGTWPEAPVFSIRFLPNGPTISTSRHVLSDDNRRLTVTDRGFGNVLNGLEFNALAVAILGDLQVPIPLDGAAPEVARFRACPAPASV